MKSSLPFRAIIALGSTLTLSGGYVIYQRSQIWPVEIRQTLREATRARNAGDAITAERLFSSVWDQVRSQKSLREKFASDESGGKLKLTGLGVCLAELRQDPQARNQTLNDCLQILEDGTLSEKEKLRKAEILYEISAVESDLTRRRKTLEDAARILIGLGKKRKPDLSSGFLSIFSDSLGLQDWTKSSEISSVLFELGQVYLQMDQGKLAADAHKNSARLLLLPPTRKFVTATDKCKATQVMLLLSKNPALPPEEKLIWARRSVQVMTKVHAQKKLDADELSVCGETYVIALLGLSQLTQDKAESEDLLIKCQNTAQLMHWEEGLAEIERVRSRL